jgi:hypothetical protein
MLTLLLANMTYLVTFFEQHLIILAQCNTKDDRGDIFEAVDPFLSLTSLTTNIKHAVGLSSASHVDTAQDRPTVCSIGPWQIESHIYQWSLSWLEGHLLLWVYTLLTIFGWLRRRNCRPVNGRVFHAANRHLLRCRVHQIELALMFHYQSYTRILPD